MLVSKVKRASVTLVSILLVVCVIASFGGSAKRGKDTFVLPDTSSAEVSTNRYTQPSTATAISGNRLSTEGFEKVLENDALELWLRRESAAIRVVDKQSGYIWGCLATDSTDDLNPTWSNMANSMLTLEYYDETNSVSQISIQDDSFENTYTIDTAEKTLSCTSECYDVGLDIGFTITLKDDHIEAAVIKDSIQEYDTNVISKVYLLPFFGCTKQGEMDGYLFVPDGSGALMRFDDTGNYDTSYVARLYGPDAGIDNVNPITDLGAKRTDDYLVPEFRATVPVYGMVHGDEQYAAMTVVEGGNDFAAIQGSLAGITLPYNWITTYFEYRQLYNQPVSKSKTIIVPQANMNKMNPKISIYLTSGDKASYSDMAVKYRSILEEKGVLNSKAKKYDEIPMRLEVLGADIKEGFIFNTTTTFTTTEEALQMQADLKEMGINQLTMIMNGWQRGGTNGNKFESFKTQNSVGTMSDLEELRDAVKAAGGNFYLQTDVTTLNSKQGRLNYLANTNISKNLVFYLRDNPSVMFKNTYLAAPAVAIKKLQNATAKLEGFDLNLPRFGSELYADYDKDRPYTRPQTRKAFVEAAEQLHKANVAVSTSAPSVYMWENTDEYFDIPMMSSQFLYETDSVPFLQIVLKGHISYYAPFANQGFYTNACILKAIEYGAYPSFFVMDADNGELRDTPMVDYFSLNFDDWKDTMKSVYGKSNTALTQVEGAHITEHKVLAKGVVRVTYDSGAKIYINYNAKEVTVDNVKISGVNFVVERG